MRHCTYADGSIVSQVETAPCVPWLGDPSNTIVDESVDPPATIGVSVTEWACWPWALLAVVLLLSSSYPRKGKK